jgi:hypothetical protein
MATFWLNNPCILFTSLNVNPFDKSNSNIENYNSLTRIILITSVILYIFSKKKQVIYTSLISLLIVVLMYKYNNNKYDYYSELSPETFETPLDSKTPENPVILNEEPYDYENTRRDLLNKNKIISTVTGNSSLQNTKGYDEFITKYSLEESQKTNKYDRTKWHDFKYLPPNEQEISSYEIPDWSSITKN